MELIEEITNLKNDQLNTPNKWNIVPLHNTIYEYNILAIKLLISKVLI